MTLTNAQCSKLEKLRRKYRIQFAQQLPQSLSSDQRKVVEAVQKLGAIRYEDYAVKSNSDYSKEPWKLQAKELAIQLTEKAERCKQRDEMTWRSHCESIVFARANAEVACPQCRQRLWRSEIEASRDDAGRASAALLERQVNRQPCRCPPFFRNLDRYEAKGTSKIFAHREGEAIVHPPTIEQELAKREKPDCVYGLRETRNFDVALHSRAAGPASSRPASGEMLVIDMIKVSALALDGDRLLFPFLFLEAKSGTAPDDWHSIKLQTCFPIRTALEIQQGLQRANGASSRWHNKPMVWFFMYKGEDWRLCVAVADRGTRYSTHNENIYHIIDLWNGSISNRNGALQLILLVDYVFDWARDIYRPAILTEVQLLAADRDSVRTISSDTDIFSTKGSLLRLPEQDLVEQDLIEQDSDELDDSKLRNLSEEFHAMDSNKGILRHVACLELHFRALFITRDNADTLVRSISSNMVQPLLRKLLSCLADQSLSIKIDTFNDIEKQWTGYSSFSRVPSLTQIRFYSVITFATYLSPRWDQVRELNVIAVAEDAFEILVNHSGLRAGRGKASVPKPSPIDASVVIEKVKQLQVQPRPAILMAAIARVQRRLQCKQTSLALAFERYQGEVRDLVHYVYNDFRKGTLDPNEPFLRGSDRLKQVTTSILPDVSAQSLEDPNASAVLVYGQARGPESLRARQSDVCIFLLHDPVQLPDSKDLTALLTHAFENSDVYHTTRDNRIVSPRSSARSGKTWNLVNTYCVYTQGPEFVDWIVHLEASPPERQGSPRISLKNGQYLLGRNLIPGYNHHRGDTIRRQRRFTIKTHRWAFLCYKIMTTEIQYWRNESQKRRESGVSCCACCAATDLQCKIFLRDEPAESEDVCWLCEAEIHEPGYPRWVWAALLGNRDRKDLRRKTHSRCIRTPPRFRHDEEQLYKELCRYSKLNEPYKDISELWKQANEYDKYQREREFRAKKLTLERRLNSLKAPVGEASTSFTRDVIVVD